MLFKGIWNESRALFVLYSLQFCDSNYKKEVIKISNNLKYQTLRRNYFGLRYRVVVGHMTADKMVHLCTDEMHDYPFKNFTPNSATDGPFLGQYLLSFNP